MTFKSVYSLPISLFFSVLHIGCCILPLFSAAAGTLPYFNIFTRYKSIFTVIQLLLLVYLFTVLAKYYMGKKSFHNQTERIVMHLSLVIVVVGLFIGYFEPFKSENQRIAEQQFAFFKNHRRLEITFLNEYDPNRLEQEVRAISGVKPGRVTAEPTSVVLTYRSDQTTRKVILEHLESKGYKVQEKQ
ncbi:hypothetical protein [Dyadobacter sp. CY312]|uniref:hypothetical protein n=1 Tax=Dyadobacter sp. CY312 TaxID=2907303 RepID=UPI001F19D688|nr:hypothetical protein [Dyadobacter sp. CY312]MCE7040340.1 hypothetical protein [Dyadobacter sp. CY312]